jgi:hypothetical protein
MSDPLHFHGCDSSFLVAQLGPQADAITPNFQIFYWLQMRFRLYRLKSYRELKNFTFLKNTVCL